MRKLALAALAVVFVLAAFALCGCASSSTSHALAREEAAARRSGMVCWVEREQGGTSGVYCGDGRLAPVDDSFVRWVR